MGVPDVSSLVSTVVDYYIKTMKTFFIDNALISKKYKYKV